MTEGISDVDGMKAFNKGIVEEFRANGGKVGGPFEGADMVLLTTTGAASGKKRMVPLVYLPIDGKIIIVGSFGGAPVDPQWVRNLRADPQVHIEVGTDSYAAVANELARAERDVLFEKVVAAAPGFGDYQKNTDRIIPLFELQRS
jgi:deazaflavin-dependent oxidoreductase (nitroreductase family)